MSKARSKSGNKLKKSQSCSESPAKLLVSRPVSAKIFNPYLNSGDKKSKNKGSRSYSSSLHAQTRDLAVYNELIIQKMSEK
jgi:hypothetical protein